MASPFLYRVRDPLSYAELTAARIDGDLVELADAFVPADTVETPAMRADSLRTLLPPHVAAVRMTAAWVHGAIADPPTRHTVQRASQRRIHTVCDVRLRYSDMAVPADHLQRVGHLWVTIPERTLTDLVRDHLTGDVSAMAAADAMRAWMPTLLARTAVWLETAPRLQHKRAALRFLKEQAREERE